MAYTSPYFTAWGRQRVDPRKPTTNPFATSYGGRGKPGYRYQPPGAAPATSSSTTTTGAQPAGGRPLDPVLEQTVGALGKRRDDTFAGLANEQVGTLANYGYGGTFDQQGALTGLSFDPSNPFSRAALLRRNYQQSKAGTQTGYAARGQFDSGAYQRAQNTNDFGYLSGENALQSALSAALASILQRRRNAGTDYELGSADAGAASVNRLIAGDTGL